MSGRTLRRIAAVTAATFEAPNIQLNSPIFFLSERYAREALYQKVSDVTGFLVAGLNHPLITALSTCWKGKADLGKDPRQSHQRSAQATLVTLNEFKRYLEVLEKDLSRGSKKYSNREIAQCVGFVAAGIHEALSYLEIVKKVIVKTERAVAKRNSDSQIRQ